MSSDEEDITFYGNALDPIDEDSLPRKKPITAEDQFAKDERGRRRFHGAFTGGFSAGFFNSVGSLGGWQPANFISSRVSRAESKGQTIFDFMDEEDTGEHGICPITLQVKPDFDNKAPSRANKKRSRIPGTEKLQHAPAVQKMLAPVRDTVGVKLLMKMGWKPGQGVGPRITKKEKKQIKHQEKTVKKVYGCSLPTDVTKSEESSESDLDIDLDEITFAPDDYQPYVVNPKQNVFGIGYQGMDRNPILSSKKPELSVLTVGGKTIRGQAFGVSVFEDEDEDIYSTEDMSNYDFSLPSAEEKRKVEKKSRFEPLHKCIEGFHVAYKPPKPREIFPLPEVPQDFVPLQSRKNRWDVTTRNVVPKKITSVTERNKIFNEIHTNTEKLGETESQKTDETIEKEIETFKPSNASSFKPFSADVEKQTRYEKFLMFKDLGLKDRISSIYPKTMTEWEKQREQSEFEQAARLYRPLADDLASRFTSGSKLDDVHDMLNPVEKTTDPDLEMMKDAAEKKMYGIFTRRTYDWIPDKIVCKRFNIPEPFKYTLQNAADRKPKESRTSIFDFLKTSNINNLPKTVPKPEPEILNEIELNSDEKVEEEKQQHEDYTKPEELDSEDEGLSEITDKVDLFKAIFLDTSDEEDENEAEKVENETPPSSKFTCEEAKKCEEASIIVRSPPRGIFANLDLESLKPKSSLSKNEQDPSKNSLLKDRSDPKPKIIDPLLYGPQLPTVISSSNIKVEPKIEYIKPKRKDDEKLVWVEKSKKHKERKKHKKQKHKKHKKHK